MTESEWRPECLILLMNSSDYFNDLCHSIATARLLLRKAHDNGCVIEGICLYVSIIDGFLRLAVIYSRTKNSPNHSYSFDKNFIRQDEGERTQSEKEIYDIAFREKIISEKLYKELREMYQFRNKVVHRFNISNINYTQVAEACTKFESIYHEIFDIVALLEHGPRGIPDASAEEMELFHSKALKKILGK